MIPHPGPGLETRSLRLQSCSVEIMVRHSIAVADRDAVPRDE